MEHFVDKISDLNVCQSVDDDQLRTNAVHRVWVRPIDTEQAERGLIDAREA